MYILANGLKFKKIADLAVIFCIIGGVLFISGLRGYLNLYPMATQRQLIAEIECRKLGKSERSFLEVEFYQDEIFLKKQIFPFKADEWIFEGRIVKWKDWTNLLKDKIYYKLDYLRGRYVCAGKEKKWPLIVYNLSGKPDKFWGFIFKYQKFIPFIRVMYSNTIFIPFEEGKRFRLYIAKSGFIIMDNSLPQKREWWLVG